MIYIDWTEDDDGLQVERATEIAEEVLKKGYPIDILIQQYWGIEKRGLSNNTRLLKSLVS